MGLKEKLSRNEITIGSWVTIGHTSIIEILATAGFDWLTIDMEHSVIELDIAQNLVATIHAQGIEALVRVGKNEDILIKRVMDTGADGVIVPMICSKEDAEKAVNAVKYPPEGTRGVGLARAQRYGIGFEEYNKWLHESSIVIAQIEHIKAVENIDAITSVKGIDAIIIGPYDLSASMCIPGDYESNEVIEALKRVETICLKKNVSLGYHVIKPNHEEVDAKIENGYTFIAFSIDFLFLGEMARREMKSIKNQ